MSRPRLAVLDLVGTTVVADDAVPRAFVAALEAEGVSLGADALADVRGATKRRALESLLPPGPDQAMRVERAYGHFTALLREAYAPGRVSAVPGAEDVIARLLTAGVRVALNTGFDRALTAHLLAVLGWTSAVDTVICGDDVPQGRPAPYLIFRAMEQTGVVDVQTVANVGDTALDLAAGANAGVRWNIGVWSGAHDRARLARAPHSHLCRAIDDVPAILGFD